LGIVSLEHAGALESLVGIARGVAAEGTHVGWDLMHQKLRIQLTWMRRGKSSCVYAWYRRKAGGSEDDRPARSSGDAQQCACMASCEREFL
jgi:hypothetical protein